MGPGLSFPYAVPSSLDGGSGFIDPGEKWSLYCRIAKWCSANCVPCTSLENHKMGCAIWACHEAAQP